MTNQANRIRYRLWAPIYDALVGRFYAAERRRTAALPAIRSGRRILLPGVGTGADLPLLPAGSVAVGVDLSMAMLRRAQARLPQTACSVLLVCGDAQALPLRAGCCDCALLSLIVSVVADGAACIREATRVVQPGGMIVIYDKFLPDQAVAGRGRRLLNVLARLIGTDINRRLGDLLAGSGGTIRSDQPGAVGGAYRTVVVQTTLRDVALSTPAAQPGPTG